MEIWLPERARPVLFCRVCGEGYPERDRAGYERHVVRCADEHQDQLAELRLSARLPAIYGEDTIDRELEGWVDEHRVELIEGRKRLS